MVRKPCRILLVDDVPAVRESLTWALEEDPDLMVVGEAGSGNEALMQVHLLRPDVVILDVELPDLNGFAVTRSLKQLSSPPMVILLSVHSDPAAQGQGVAAGADAFVSKGQGWPELIEQVRRLLPRRT